MPSHPFAAPIRAMAAPLQGAARDALLHAADQLDQLPPVDRPHPAASTREQLEAETLAMQLEDAVWHDGMLGQPWQDIASLRALPPAKARRLAAAALAQWPAAAAAELARHHPLDLLRHALAQLLSLLQWQLQLPGEDPRPELLEFDALLRRRRGSRDRPEGHGRDIAGHRTEAVAPARQILVDDGDSLHIPPAPTRRGATTRGTRSAPAAAPPGAGPA
jgi:hypothetical protein